MRKKGLAVLLGTVALTAGIVLTGWLYGQREKQTTFEACVVEIDAERQSILVSSVEQGELGYLHWKNDAAQTMDFNSITAGDLVKVTYGGFTQSNFPVGYMDVTKVSPTGTRNVELARKGKEQLMSAEQQADLESPTKEPQASFAAGEDPDFGEQARKLGYTEEMLDSLVSSGFTPREILNPHEMQSYADIADTSDGRYTLGSFGVEYSISYLLVTDHQTGTFQMLDKMQNGFCTFGIIDNTLFYAAIAQVGGAVYPAGVYVYRFDRPREPIGSWILTDVPMSSSSGEAGEVEKRLLSAYYDKTAEKLLVAHCKIPVAWGGWLEEPGRSCWITALDKNGKEEFTIDTQIVPLQQGNQGIQGPSFEGEVSFGVLLRSHDRVFLLCYETKSVETID